MAPSKRVLVVVVAYHSRATIAPVIDAACAQLGYRDRLVVVDNGDGLSRAARERIGSGLLIEGEGNRGFAGGNNEALRRAGWRDYEYVLLVNPDLVLPDGWIERAICALQAPESVGIVSGPLIRYDFERRAALDEIDSAGIARTWNGRWLDVHRGAPVSFIDRLPERYTVRAVCGALMLIPTAVIAQVRPNGALFDERFFAYKEDIDLCLGFARRGWRCFMHKSLLAYHGRGWKKNRADVPYYLRVLSARNDVLLHFKHFSPYVIASLVKYVYVRLWEPLLLLAARPSKSAFGTRSQ